MWIEFDSLFTLENKVRQVARELMDITNGVEQRLRGGNLPYKKIGNYISVDEKDYEKYPDVRIIFEEYQQLYDKALKSLGIVEELPYRPSTSGTPKEPKKTKE
jgi:hypothetical protein